MLAARDLPGGEVGDVGLAGDRVDDHGRGLGLVSRPVVGERVVEHAGRRAAEDGVVVSPLSAAMLMVSAPSLPNSTIEPTFWPKAKMLSFSVPSVTWPVLPTWRMTMSAPEPPFTVTAPER